jgi:hypothetical protein
MQGGDTVARRVNPRRVQLLWNEFSIPIQTCKGATIIEMIYGVIPPQRGATIIGKNTAINSENPIGVKCRRHEIYLKCHRHEISIEMEIASKTNAVGVACLLNSCYNRVIPMVFFLTTL